MFPCGSPVARICISLIKIARQWPPRRRDAETEAEERPLASALTILHSPTFRANSNAFPAGQTGGSWRAACKPSINHNSLARQLFLFPRAALSVSTGQQAVSSKQQAVNSEGQLWHAALPRAAE